MYLNIKFFAGSQVMVQMIQNFKKGKVENLLKELYHLLCASLAILHLVSNVGPWHNCSISTVLFSDLCILL